MNSHEFGPRIVPHLLLAILHATLAAAFGAGLYSFLSGLLQSHEDPAVFWMVAGLAALMAVLFWLSATALLRRGSLLFNHAQLRLSPEGIFVRCYRHGYLTLIRPWYHWTERQIAWTDFRGCRVHRIVLNGVVPLKKSLFLASTGPEIEITWGMFHPSVERLQTEILDYHRLTIVAPAGESARVPEFLSLLFREPRMFSAPRLGRTEIAVTILLIPVAGALFCLQFTEYGLPAALAAYAVLAAVALGIGILILRRWIAASRFIQLSGDGIAIGPDAPSARLIAWHDLAFARVHALADKAPSSLTKLELRLGNGTAVFIRALPTASRLAALIDPPAESVRQAWRLIGQGHSATEAARAVGLPV